MKNITEYLNEGLFRREERYFNRSEEKRLEKNRKWSEEMAAGWFEQFQSKVNSVPRMSKENENLAIDIILTNISKDSRSVDVIADKIKNQLADKCLIKFNEPTIRIGDFIVSIGRDEVAWIYVISATENDAEHLWWDWAPNLRAQGPNSSATPYTFDDYLSGFESGVANPDYTPSKLDANFIRLKKQSENKITATKKVFGNFDVWMRGGIERNSNKALEILKKFFVMLQN